MNNGFERGSGNIAIDNFIIGPEAWSWRHKFVSNDAVPACDLENKVIMSPMFGAILDEKDDTIVRGKNEHEAGHARLTPHNKLPHWSSLKGNVVNALEDLRIEKAVGLLSEAIKSDLSYLNRSVMADINRKMMNGELNIKPVDEALLAMHMTENGVAPAWVLSTKAQAYFDAAYPVYQTWRDIRNLDNKHGFAEIEAIADKVIAAMKDALKNQKPENQENGDDGDNGQSGDKGESENNKSQNGQSDNDNDENNGGSASSDPEDEGEENRNNEQSNNADDSEGQGGNGEDTDGEETDEDTKDGNSADDNADEENGDNEDGNEGQSGSQQSVNDEKGNDNSNGANDSGDAGDEQDGGESDKNAANKGENRRNNKKKPSNEAGSADDDVTPGNDGDNKHTEKKNEKPERSEADIENELNNDFGNNEVENKVTSEKLQKIFDKSQEITDGYTAFTGNDRIITAEESKEGYERARRDISTQISMLSSYTEDALKAMSRVAYQRNLERGKIDRKKLVGLSKSLTKKVFYKAKDGIDLDVAVTVMIDESGSIGSMCYQLRSLAIAFGEVFTRLGINFEVLGYTTGDRSSHNVKLSSNVVRTTPMVIYEHKTFDEPYQVAKYKLGSISSYDCNIDGESLLLAFKRIKVQRVNRRIIFVLSDGMPNQGYNSGALYRHLTNSVKFIRQNGVEVYGFGIGTSEPKKFYGEDSFIYLDDIKNLGPQFFRRFREIVAKR